MVVPEEKDTQLSPPGEATCFDLFSSGEREGAAGYELLHVGSRLWRRST